MGRRSNIRSNNRPISRASSQRSRKGAPKPKRLGLQSAHDLLRKLRWEMRQMDQIKSEDEVDEVGAYQASMRR